MKNVIWILVLSWALSSFAAIDEKWSAKGSAVLKHGVNQAGNECITAVGSGTGGGYGGLLLTTPIDLRGATEADTIRIKLFQNLSWLTVMLRGKDGSIYRGIQLPNDGNEVVLKLDRKLWTTGKGDNEQFFEYDDIVFYASFFKHPSQTLGITDLVIEKGGKKLYEYHSDNTLPPRKNQVRNFGIGGFNTRDVLRQLPQVVSYQPSLAIIMIGCNDMSNVHKLVPIEEYEENLRKITAELEKSGAKIILVTPPPCIEALVYRRQNKEKIGGDGALAKIRRTGDVMRRLAEEKKYVLVDFFALVNKNTPLDGPKSYLRNPANSGAEDGVHPTKEGYQALAKKLAEEIKAKNLPVSKVACIGDSITFGSAMTGSGTATGDCYPGVLATLLNP